MKRKTIRLTKRFAIMRRDGFKCRLCGRSPSTTIGLVLEVDHIHPVSKGGSDSYDNLQTVCFECNRGKRDNLLTTVGHNPKSVASANTISRHGGLCAPEEFSQGSIDKMRPIFRACADMLADHGWIKVVDKKAPTGTPSGEPPLRVHLGTLPHLDSMESAVLLELLKQKRAIIVDASECDVTDKNIITIENALQSDVYNRINLLKESGILNPVISGTVVNDCGEFDRVIIKCMADKGEVTIVEQPTGSVA